MKEPSLPICLSCQIERETPKSLLYHFRGRGWRGGLHATEAKLFMIESQRHSYHLVDPSPWPISGSLGALATTVGGVMYMHSFQGGATLLSLGLIFILYTMFVWWRDVLRESTLEGHHTKVVQLGPRYGSIPFIVSEVMFLFALFRASSHSSLAPTVEIGGIWPPKGIGVLDPWEIPFLNTLIPPSSGAAVTWAHHAILAGKEKRAVYALVATVLLALVFTGFQGMEYYQAPFTISDSIYGSTFFLATGFHGFHVIIGTLFSIICGIRQYLGHLTKEHHVGFEAAAWYWHFVDVVRLFPFVSIYWWGGIWRNESVDWRIQARRQREAGFSKELLQLSHSLWLSYKKKYLPLSYQISLYSGT